MAIKPRMYLKGFNLQTYNATESSPFQTFNKIVTSQYNTETKKLISLGTVFRFRAYGYAYIIDGGTYSEAQEMYYEGASRVVWYPSTADAHPQQINAFIGWSKGDTGYRPLFMPGDYSAPNVTPGQSSGALLPAMATAPTYFYITLVAYATAEDANFMGGKYVSAFVSGNPEFSTVETSDSFHPYPYPAFSVVQDDSWGTEGWAMTGVEFIPVDVVVPLPGYAVTVTQRGETGVIVGAELQDTSGVTIEDISAEVQYSIVGTEYASIDSNRQLVIADEGELPESFEIKITWDSLPYETHNILVTVDIDDDNGDSGGDEGGDTDIIEIDISTQLGLAIGLGLEGWAARGDTNV